MTFRVKRHSLRDCEVVEILKDGEVVGILYPGPVSGSVKVLSAHVDTVILDSDEGGIPEYIFRFVPRPYTLQGRNVVRDYSRG
jgi:hypothetical protein